MWLLDCHQTHWSDCSSHTFTSGRERVRQRSGGHCRADQAPGCNFSFSQAEACEGRKGGGSFCGSLPSPFSHKLIPAPQASAPPLFWLVTRFFQAASRKLSPQACQAQIWFRKSLRGLRGIVLGDKTRAGAGWGGVCDSPLSMQPRTGGWGEINTFQPKASWGSQFDDRDNYLCSERSGGTPQVCPICLEHGSQVVLGDVLLRVLSIQGQECR